MPAKLWRHRPSGGMKNIKDILKAKYVLSAKKSVRSIVGLAHSVVSVCCVWFQIIHFGVGGGRTRAHATHPLRPGGLARRRKLVAEIFKLISRREELWCCGLLSGNGSEDVCECHMGAAAVD